MILIAILVCLALEIFISTLSNFRKYDWFLTYSSRLLGLSDKSGSWVGPVRVIVVLLLPLFVVAILDTVLGNTWLGLPELAFAVCILAWSLRYQVMDHAIDQYIEASESGDEQQLFAAGESILGSTTTGAYQTRDISDAIIIQTNERLFSVIFWFVILGPMGALLYRLAWVLYTLSEDKEWSDDFLRGAAQHLYGILSWIPARLSAIAYALVGSFEPAANGWRDCSGANEEDLVTANDKLLLCVGSGAMQVDTPLDAGQETDGQDINIVTAARGLVLRSLLVWIIVIALVTLAGWIL